MTYGGDDQGVALTGNMRAMEKDQAVKDSIQTAVHELRAEVEVAQKEFSNLSDKVMPFLVMEDTIERSMSEPGVDPKNRPGSDVKRQIQEIGYSVNELTRRIRIITRQVDA